MDGFPNDEGKKAEWEYLEPPRTFDKSSFWNKQLCAIYFVESHKTGGITEMVEVRNLTKRYGANLAVDHVSFTIEEGSIVGFLGPNGAGKLRR